MSNVIGFFIGMSVGAIFGVSIMTDMITSGRESRREEEELRKRGYERKD